MCTLCKRLSIDFIRFFCLDWLSQSHGYRNTHRSAALGVQIRFRFNCIFRNMKCKVIRVYEHWDFFIPFALHSLLFWLNERKRILELCMSIQTTDFEKKKRTKNSIVWEVRQESLSFFCVLFLTLMQWQWLWMGMATFLMLAACIHILNAVAKSEIINLHIKCENLVMLKCVYSWSVRTSHSLSGHRVCFVDWVLQFAVISTCEKRLRIWLFAFGLGVDEFLWEQERERTHERKI